MRKVLSFLNENIEKILSVSCLATMSVLIVIQVFFRYVLQNSLSWTEETARYLFIMLSYFAASYGVKEGKHITVDIIHNYLPRKAKRIYEMISYLIFFVFALIIIYLGSKVCLSIAETGQLTSSTHIPMQFVYTAVPVGFALCAFRLVQSFIFCIKDLKAAKSDALDG